MRYLVLLTIALASCTGPTGPCGEDGPAVMDIAQDGHAFGDYALGDPIEFFPPPQGGGPICAYRIRLRGIDGEIAGVEVDMEARDLAGQTLTTDFTIRRFICANAGPQNDWFVSAAFHLQFVGADPTTLDGQEVEIEIIATAPDGSTATQIQRGPLSFLSAPP